MRAGGALALAVGIVLGGVPGPAGAADPVQRVEIRLTIEGGEPHPLVVRRIAESIGSAAERLLIGRDSELVARQGPALLGVLREVTDRVVRGYRAAEMSVQAGATAVVLVRLHPVPPLMTELPITATIDGVHPDAQPLVSAALEAVLPAMGRLPARLPADALEWAAPVLERQMAEMVEGAVPGFSGSARILSAPDRIVLRVAARDQRVIRDIGVRFRSTSIPFVLLEQHAPQVTSMAEPLRGLPIAFALEQQSRLEALIARRLAAYPPARQYAIVARPLLQVGELTRITVLADSTLYRGRLEARINFGSQAPPADVRAQLGRAFGSLEPYLEARLEPQTLSVAWTAGLRVALTSSLTVGVTAGLGGGGLEPFLHYRLSPDMHLRASYVAADAGVETTIAYRLNEFLSWEGVATSRGIFWIRVVSNL